jgi:hypothetical protein
MPDPEDILDVDFETELRGLFQEAEQVLESRAAAARKSEPTTPERPVSVAELPQAFAKFETPSSLSHVLRPLLLGMEALTRAAGDNSRLLERLDERFTQAAEAEDTLPALVAELRAALEIKSRVNQQMFDALYEELKGYKDGFLLESVHRPIIRDVVSLYDETVEIHRQIGATLEACRAEDSQSAIFARIQTLEINLAHNLAFVLEVLARLDVMPMPIGSGPLDKRTQRTVALVFVDSPEEDSVVARTVKRGFLWKERLLRAEEVVTKKWRGSLAVSPEAAAGNEPLPPRAVREP